MKHGPWHLLNGNARRIPLADDSVHCVVTSPPYFALRDYGVAGQIGLEPSLDDFIQAMVEVFREVRRVLRPDGTCWINMGDSYMSGQGGRQSSAGLLPLKAKRTSGTPRKREGIDVSGWSSRDVTEKVIVTRESGLKPKDLMNVPHRLALALQADGWWHRDTIIWHKPNPMPSSVTDRTTTAHEYVFLMTKRPRYYFDAEAIREGYQSDARKKPGPSHLRGQSKIRPRGNMQGTHDASRWYGETGRNKRSVWRVSTEPMKASGYDFSAADYVDDRGIPRKWSPSCPVHERDGRPRQSSRAEASCGEPPASVLTGNECSGIHPASSPASADVPIESYRTLRASGNPSDALGDDTCGNKTHGQPHAAGPQIESRTTGTPASPVPSTTDSRSLACERSATLHSRGTSKSSRDGSDASGDTGVGATAPRKHRTEPSSFDQGSSNQSSKSEGENHDCASRGHASRSAHTQFGRSCNQDKCTCAISQTSHFATFPQKLITPCILAGTSEKGVCPACGAPWRRVVEKMRVPTRPGDGSKVYNPKDSARVDMGMMSRATTLHQPGWRKAASEVGNRDPQRHCSTTVSTTWVPGCKCGHDETVPATVFDPFSGAGTTLIVSARHGRRGIGLELNPAYIGIAGKRIVTELAKPPKGSRPRRPRVPLDEQSLFGAILVGERRR